MGFEAIKDKDGNVIGHAIICRSRARARCKFCGGERDVTKLCDFPVARGRTCDAGMCGKCATNIGANRDVCPTHKGLDPNHLS